MLEVGFPGWVDGGCGGEEVLADCGPGAVCADEERAVVSCAVFEDGFDGAGGGVFCGSRG